MPGSGAHRIWPAGCRQQRPQQPRYTAPPRPPPEAGAKSGDFGGNEKSDKVLSFKKNPDGSLTYTCINEKLSGIKNGNFTNEFSLSDAIGKFSRGKKTPMTSLRDTEEQIEIKI